MTEIGLRILVVDDEPAIRRYLCATLNAHGFIVSEAASGEEALLAASIERPNLVILDLGLPDIDGVEVAHRLREWSSTPIIILSVRDQESDKIAALDAGADDYLTKPFGTGELMARIRVALRHSLQPTEEPTLQFDNLKIDLARRIVTLDGQEVALTPNEYDLLRILAMHAGRVMTHRQLLRMVWGNAYEEELHILRVNMSNLRRKIEPNASRPHYILTEPGVGYRLRAD